MINPQIPLPPRHRPSGSMCCACFHKDRNCSNLAFESMRPMKTDADGVIVVRCDDFTVSQRRKA